MTDTLDFLISIDIIGNVKKMYIEGDFYINSKDKTAFYKEFDTMINKFRLTDDKLDEKYYEHYNKQFNSR